MEPHRDPSHLEASTPVWPGLKKDTELAHTTETVDESSSETTTSSVIHKSRSGSQTSVGLLAGQASKLEVSSPFLQKDKPPALGPVPVSRNLTKIYITARGCKAARSSMRI